MTSSQILVSPANLWSAVQGAVHGALLCLSGKTSFWGEQKSPPAIAADLTFRIGTNYWMVGVRKLTHLADIVPGMLRLVLVPCMPLKVGFAEEAVEVPRNSKGGVWPRPYIPLVGL